ncbi:S-layer homology domain-containing protein [Bifidobacterium pseudolongum]|nr:S-layer homology domain-containing protein [Bifidobacterium pseudolongum]
MVADDHTDTNEIERGPDMKKYMTRLTVAAAVLAALIAPTSSAYANGGAAGGISPRPIAGNPVEISNIQVSNITDTTADVSFDYSLNSDKMWYYGDSGKTKAGINNIDAVCFVVNVSHIFSVTAGDTAYNWDDDREMPDEWEGNMPVGNPCGNVDNLGRKNKSVSVDAGEYHNQKEDFIFGSKNGKYSYYSFYTYIESNDSNEIANTKHLSVTLSGLRPGTFYGNKNLPTSPEYSGNGTNFATFDSFYAKSRQSTSGVSAAKWTAAAWNNNLFVDAGNGISVNSGKRFDVDTDILFVGSYVQYKNAHAVAPAMYNATHIPDFTTKVSFVDVSASTPHVDDIRWLADRGISTGWKEADGKYEFRGMSPVARQDMAAFLRREAKNRGVGDAASWRPSAADWKRFRDVNKSTPHAEDILWLAHAGISTGWKEADGTSTFRGMSPVVRQDMAAFLKRLAARAGKDGGVNPKIDFTDVTAATPHRADVQWLGGSGISQGYRNPDGSWRFEGMTSVYRQDMAAFIHRLDNQLNK